MINIDTYMKFFTCFIVGNMFIMYTQLIYDQNAHIDKDSETFRYYKEGDHANKSRVGAGHERRNVSSKHALC